MTAEINRLLVHHGQIVKGYRGTTRVNMHVSVRPSSLFMSVMGGVANSIEGIEIVLRGKLDEDIILIIAPGIRAREVSELWIHEVNTCIREMPESLRERLDGTEMDSTRGMAVYSHVGSYNSAD